MPSVIRIHLYIANWRKKMFLMWNIAKNKEKRKFATWWPTDTTKKHPAVYTFQLVLLKRFTHIIQSCTTGPIRSVLKLYATGFALDALCWHVQSERGGLQNIWICLWCQPDWLSGMRCFKCWLKKTWYIHMSALAYKRHIYANTYICSCTHTIKLFTKLQ